jgi:hypothetical protein
MSPEAQWFGAAMFLVIGIVFVLVGVGVITSCTGGGDLGP